MSGRGLDFDLELPKHIVVRLFGEVGIEVYERKEVREGLFGLVVRRVVCIGLLEIREWDVLLDDVLVTACSDMKKGVFDSVR